jgi:hypothetical protein
VRESGLRGRGKERERERGRGSGDLYTNKKVGERRRRGEGVKTETKASPSLCTSQKGDFPARGSLINYCD